MKKTTLAAAASITIILASGVHGAITYTDADFAVNTTLADGTAMNDAGGVGSLTNPEDYYLAGDGTVTPAFNWGVRDRTDVNGTDVIVASQNSQHAGIETDAPILRTSATVPNGTYNVFVYWQGTWAPQAGLTVGSLAYMAGSETTPSAGDFTNPGGMQFPGFGLKQTQLAGTATVTGGVLDVYIDDNGSFSADRTWYDGIGYELVPEPSSVALFGLAGLGCLARRRRS